VRLKSPNSVPIRGQGNTPIARVIALIMQRQDFENRLRAQTDFPSPSRVATEIVALARDPEIEMAKVAQAVGRDPAIAAKILRMSNSAYYAQRRPSQNLRQALIVIGLNAALTLALSFSLVSSMRALKAHGIDYPRFWRRALLAATAARAFGQTARARSEEDLFLAGLLQDMGVLAIDRVERNFYGELPSGSGHADWSAYEVARLGRDHAYYTSLMLSTWNVPERICRGIANSHSADAVPASIEDGVFARCLALGSDLAEAIVGPDRARAITGVAAGAGRLLGLTDSQTSEVISRVTTLIPEIEELYETSILDADDADALLAQARELLAERNLQTLQEVSALQATTNVLLSRTEEIEEAHRRDTLTSALTRVWLDRLFEQEFSQAVVFGRYLSVAYVDIDRFRIVNEKFGTDVGDELLKACADALASCVRGTDLVGRFAGEEFLVVLPGAELDVATQIAQRMLAALAAIRIVTPQGTATVSASIGVVTCATRQQYASAAALLEAADHALYAAKLKGRNRVEALDEAPQTGHRSVATPLRA
jgi:diguanylate cyclase (GGDEF)-like protein